MAIWFSILSLINYPNIQTNNKKVFLKAIHFFKKENINFVDSILVSNIHEAKATIYSFDKKLNRLSK
jgi:predicted nucleic-acid-binding protein